MPARQAELAPPIGCTSTRWGVRRLARVAVVAALLTAVPNEVRERHLCARLHGMSRRVTARLPGVCVGELLRVRGSRRDGSVGPSGDAHSVAGTVGEDPARRGVGLVD